MGESIVQADVERYETLFHLQPVGNSEVVLCNLTKAEYVRENGITIPPGSRAFPLVNVLISQICWSEGDWDMDENTTQTLIHGPWAGHRFCCIRLKDLPDVPKGLEKWLIESDLATLMAIGLGALYSQLGR